MKDSTNKKNINIELISQIGMLFGFVVFRAIMSQFFMSLTRITGEDEFGTIAWAAMLSGCDWSGIVGNIGFYGFGYSVLMTPFFILVKNPVILYRIMQTYNGVCIGLSAIVCYRILKKHFHINNNLVRVGISVACAGTFTNLFYSNVIYNECILTLITWVTFYLLLEIVCEEKRRVAHCIELAFVLAYSLTVHSRSLFIIGTVMVCLTCFGLSRVINRKMIKRIVLIVVGVISISIVTLLVLNRVQSMIWSSDDNEVVGNTILSSFKVFKNISILGTRKGFESFIISFVGQLFAFNVVTAGVGSVYFAMFIYFVHKRYAHKESDDNGDRKKSESAYLWGYLFTFVFIITVFTLMALDHVSKEGAAGLWYKYILYIRYWSPAIGIVFMLVLSTLAKAKKLSFRVIEVSICILITTLVIFIKNVSLITSNFDVFPLITSIITKYMGILFVKDGDIITPANYIIASLLIMLLTGGLLACGRTKFKNCTCLIIIMFSLYMYLYSTINHEIPNSRVAYETGKIVSEAIPEDNVNLVINMGSYHDSKLIIAAVVQYTNRNWKVTEDIDTDMDVHYVMSQEELEGLTYVTSLPDTVLMNGYKLYKIQN